MDIAQIAARPEPRIHHWKLVPINAAIVPMLLGCRRETTITTANIVGSRNFKTRMPLIPVQPPIAPVICI